MKWFEKYLKGKSNKSISDDNTTIKETVQKKIFLLITGMTFMCNERSWEQKAYCSRNLKLNSQWVLPDYC